MSDVASPIRPRIGVTTHRHDLAGEMCLSPFYTESVLTAGGLPLVVPMYSDAAVYADVLDLFDGFLLTGSEADVYPELYGKTPPPANYSDPLRDIQDFAILRHAEAAGKPVFGICRGCQVMNVYRGGTLALHFGDLITTDIQHDHDDHIYGPPVHRVMLQKGTALAGLIADTTPTVNSLHRQVCENVGQGLRIAAVSEDGLIEAVEDTENPTRFFAVQWHPERSNAPQDEFSKALFSQLIRESGAWRTENRPPA